MPQGKRFTAAEKHFEKKRVILQAEINQYKSTLASTYKELVQTRDKANILEAENGRLKEWIERLLEYTNLTENDIKQVCEAEKKSGEALRTFASIMNTVNVFGCY